MAKVAIFLMPFLLILSCRPGPAVRKTFESNVGVTIQLSAYRSGDVWVDIKADEACVERIVHSVYLVIYGDLPPEPENRLIRELRETGKRRDLDMRRVPVEEVFPALSEALGIELDPRIYTRTFPVYGASDQRLFIEGLDAVQSGELDDARGIAERIRNESTRDRLLRMIEEQREATEEAGVTNQIGSRAKTYLGLIDSESGGR